MNPMNVMEKAPKEDNKIIWLIASVVVFVMIIAIWFFWPQGKEGNNPNLSEQVAEKQQTATSSASYKNALMPEIEKDDHLFGNNDAMLDIIVYEDLSQSFSGKLDDSLDKLKKEHEGDLKIAYRSLALNGPLSIKTAQAVECAFLKEKGWDFRKSVIDIVRERTILDEDFALIANKLGLNEEEFSTCLLDPKKTSELATEAKNAAKYGVIGAPTIFIGDEMINGARPLEDFVDSSNDKIEGLKTIINRKLQ